MRLVGETGAEIRTLGAQLGSVQRLLALPDRISNGGYQAPGLTRERIQGNVPLRRWFP